MDTSDSSGNEGAQRQCVYNADLLGGIVTGDEYRFLKWHASVSNVGAERFARLSKAVAEGDIAAAHQVLRVWGIR